MMRPRSVGFEAVERRAPADRRARPPIERRPARPETDELVARLERLETLVAAIAEHLGVRPGRLPPRRAAVRREGGKGPEEAARAARVVAHVTAAGLTGHVKLYHASRGYGFVVSPGAAGEVFFHRSDCRVDPETLEPGAEVVFDLAEMANGRLKAIRLRPRGTRPAPSTRIRPVEPLPEEQMRKAPRAATPSPSA